VTILSRWIPSFSRVSLRIWIAIGAGKALPEVSTMIRAGLYFSVRLVAVFTTAK
jgi:hypothetical protein